MREISIVIGLILLAAALRSARMKGVRKLGALMMLVASFCLFQFITGSLAAGFIGVGAWFFLPWFELLTRVRKMKLPLNNRLRPQEIPNPAFFPNASEAAAAMEEANFEHSLDCGWDWAGMKQYFQLFWNPEERAIASVCLCEQSNVAFAFITITSQDTDGNIWRTTNFPFAPSLRCPPHVRWNHVPCERSCFHHILADHHGYLAKMKIPSYHLRVPDPDEIQHEIESEMRVQLQHNLDAKFIQLTGDGYFQYSKRGLLFLWGQSIKDMIRLC